MNILEAFGETDDQLEYKGKKVEVGSRWVCPEDQSIWEANPFGLFEEVTASPDKETGTGRVISFAAAPDLVLESEYRASVPFAPVEPEDCLSDDEYIDLCALASRKGVSSDTLVELLKAKGVEFDEIEDGQGAVLVTAPNSITRSQGAAVAAALELMPDIEPELPVLNWNTQLLGLKMQAKDRGISEHQFTALVGPIKHQFGRTQRAVDEIAARIVLPSHDEETQETACGGFTEPPILNEPEPVVNEDGEVLNAEEVYEYLDLNAKACDQLQILEPEAFSIRDEATANWFVTKMRESQDRCERIAEMAHAGLKQELTKQARMMGYYGQQLRTYAAARLPKTKDGTKYRSKNVKFLEGAVHFKKTGGLKCVDKLAVQQFVDSLEGYQHHYRSTIEDALEYLAGGNTSKARELLEAALLWESPLDTFPVKIERKANLNDLKKMVVAGVKVPGYVDLPVDELAQMSIGGAKPWSLNKLKDQLKGIKIDDFKAAIQGGTDDDEDVIEGEVI